MTHLTFPFPQAPQPAASQLVAPGVYWLRLTLPFPLDHINIWLLEENNGWTVVDCGLGNDATRETWEVIFSVILQDKPITRVICTHMHPDHIGSAAWLCQRWSASFWMTSAEYLSARILSAGLPGTDASSAVAHYARHGLPYAQQEKIAARAGFYRQGVPGVPPIYQRLQQDDVVSIAGRTWRVLCGYGHSPEHASLVCDALNLVIAGDMLLPKISTNVAVYPLEPEGDPLRLFLSSLTAFNALPEDILVLPSHGLPFIGAQSRVRELQRHHAERLQALYAACRVPLTAMQTLPILFRRELDLHQLTFALGEAIAHLNYGWHSGYLYREEYDGVYHFVASSVGGKPSVR